MSHWSTQTVFYHIYPLGQCNAPEWNNFQSTPVHRLEELNPWVEHAASLGCNGLYLGPLFESTSHGYDTADYYNVDRRLGDRGTLKRLVQDAHQLGMRVILDGVFNHVGRDFWAFRDVLANRQNSPWCDWVKGLRFDRNNKYNDGFCYETWDGHENLVKLNLNNRSVRDHLLGAVKHWIEDYEIDGLRLDAADVVDKDFLSELASYSKQLKSDFWLMGEVVHGDYRHWANPNRLDSVTNYETFKGLYSSFNDHNFFEIAWSFNRQFGPNGMYHRIPLYAFADNHDVSRVASLLNNESHLISLYTLLMSMPGTPSIYYGSEFAVKADKKNGDPGLRPHLDLNQLKIENQWTADEIKKLIHIRLEQPALQEGEYQQLYLTNEQFAFRRSINGNSVLAVFNAANREVEIEIPIPKEIGETWRNALHPEVSYQTQNQRLKINLPPESSMLLI